MEAFLEQLQIVLPVLGVNAIRVRPTAASVPAASDVSPVFCLRNAKIGVDARAQQIGDEFTMLQGSQVVATCTPPTVRSMSGCSRTAPSRCGAMSAS
jgi:hypothetical protein